QAVALGRLLRKAEAALGMPVEIEWALDEEGFKLLQARPLHVEPAHVPDEIWLQHPGINGHPAGIGWASGRAVIVNCECELTRIAPGDILVTRVAGPALSHILPRVAGVVAELGGSTSHLASLARERGIPMVLGVLDATTRIPDGSQVGSTGSPESCGGSDNPPAHFHHPADRRERARTATGGGRGEDQPGFKPDSRQAEADRGRQEARHPVPAAARQDRPRGA